MDGYLLKKWGEKGKKIVTSQCSYYSLNVMKIALDVPPMLKDKYTSPRVK